MNDSVLRGFCQHNSLFFFDLKKKKWELTDYYEREPCDSSCNVSGVLSAKQIEIIEDHFKLNDQINDKWYDSNGFFRVSLWLKEKGAFLVAKILKEKEGEKE